MYTEEERNYWRAVIAEQKHEPMVDVAGLTACLQSSGRTTPYNLREYTPTMLELSTEELRKGVMHDG